MKAGSLRLRLTLSAAALIVLALLLAGAGLRVVFDTVLNTRTAEELDRTAKQIAGQAEIGADGHLLLARPPADPRFSAAYGGLYWQVETGEERLRSRSLWDMTLALPPGTLPVPDSGLRMLDLPGPEDGVLLAVVRQVRILRGTGSRELAITVAIDRRELAGSRRAFLELLVPALCGLGLVLVLAMTLFVHRALLPFRTLRTALRDIHEGRRATLPDGFPEEVQPLANDLNRLIALQDAALARARARAGDLAHGLKTPLAVLDALARRTAAAGQKEIAREVAEQSTAMGRQVQRALAQARSAASGGLRRQRTAAAPLARKLIAVLHRLPGSETLDWWVELPEALALPVAEDELAEMLGNLLDNARKWASATVRVALAVEAGMVGLVVEDDGSGMAEAEMAAIGRGRRWDETTPGTGFGLAITQELAEATGGRLGLSRTSDGGLRAMLLWPAN